MRNFYVITGPPGAGKTALLEELQARGFTGVAEPARLVLAEQRSFDGLGVPDRNPELFTALMLSRSIDQHRRLAHRRDACFFDRGVPDIIAYARLYGVDQSAVRRAARVYRYNPIVFYAPPWREIYSQDDERKMTFEQARSFGDILGDTYRELGHALIDLPSVPPRLRADFVVRKVTADRAAWYSGKRSASGADGPVDSRTPRPDQRRKAESCRIDRS